VLSANWIPAFLVLAHASVSPEAPMLLSRPADPGTATLNASAPGPTGDLPGNQHSPAQRKCGFIWSRQTAHASGLNQNAM
jgi:hypothetical protein